MMMAEVKLGRKEDEKTDKKKKKRLEKHQEE
jgi:hypothetical protein